MRGAPTAAIPKAWRQHVLDHEGSVRDPKAYVFAIIDAWRLAIKHRDVFAKPGIRYGDPRRGMLEGERSEEHTSELQSLMRISYAVFCLKKTTINIPPYKHYCGEHQYR